MVNWVALVFMADVISAATNCRPAVVAPSPSMSQVNLSQINWSLMSVLALSIWSKFVPVRVIVPRLLSYATAVIVEAGLEASTSMCVNLQYYLYLLAQSLRSSHYHKHL